MSEENEKKSQLPRSEKPGLTVGQIMDMTDEELEANPEAKAAKEEMAKMGEKITEAFRFPGIEAIKNFTGINEFSKANRLIGEQFQGIGKARESKTANTREIGDLLEGMSEHYANRPEAVTARNIEVLVDQMDRSIEISASLQKGAVASTNVAMIAIGIAVLGILAPIALNHWVYAPANKEDIQAFKAYLSELSKTEIESIKASNSRIIEQFEDLSGAQQQYFKDLAENQKKSDPALMKAVGAVNLTLKDLNLSLESRATGQEKGFEKLNATLEGLREDLGDLSEKISSDGSVSEDK